MIYRDNELDVTVGQAFHYEEQCARRAPVPTQVHIINDHFAIEEFSNQNRTRCYPAYREDGRWQYFVHTGKITIDDGRELATMNFLLFESLEEAREFIAGFVACLQAFNGLLESRRKQQKS